MTDTKASLARYRDICRRVDRDPDMEVARIRAELDAFRDDFVAVIAHLANGIAEVAPPSAADNVRAAFRQSAQEFADDFDDKMDGHFGKD